MQIDELARAYQAKSDEEIVVLAKKPEDLTPEAQSLLRGELARRRITVDSAPVQEQSELVTVLSKIPVPEPVVQGAKSSGEFLKEVTLLYRDHFWLFIKLVAPAVVISYLVTIEIRKWSRAVARELWAEGRGPAWNSTMLKLSMVNLGARLFSGLLFCLAFAAVCIAVERIREREPAKSLNSFIEVLARRGGFLVTSTILFVLICAASVVSTVPVVLILMLPGHFPRHFSYAITPITYVVFFGAMLLISRLALAMPAVILDNYRIGQAFFRSDELTQGKWIELASLLAKSVIGGYVAGMLPFWAAELLWRWVHLPEWGLDAASVLGVTMVEPFMFIGFALMYVQARETQAIE